MQTMKVTHEMVKGLVTCQIREIKVYDIGNGKGFRGHHKVIATPSAHPWVQVSCHISNFILSLDIDSRILFLSSL